MAKIVFDTLRSLGFASISGTYAAVGGVLTNACVGICITNNTDADMILTDDPLRDEIFIAKGSYKLWDIESNRTNGPDPILKIAANTQFYVKQAGAAAATQGSVYIELIYI